MRFRIKQLGRKVSTSGIHLGGSKVRRKLVPGEVVEISDDIKEGGVLLVDTIWNTGLVELTKDDVTRPFEFASENEAAKTCPNYRPSGRLALEEAARINHEVMARLKQPKKRKRRTNAEVKAALAKEAGVDVADVAKEVEVGVADVALEVES